MPRDGAFVMVMGANGFAMEVMAAAGIFYKDFGPADGAFVVEDDSPMIGEKAMGFPVIAESDVKRTSQGRQVDCYVAIGQPSIRRRVVGVMEEALGDAVEFPALIPPGTSIMGQLAIGRGVAIMPGCVLTVGVQLHEFSFINAGCCLMHGVKVGAYSGINPRSILSGEVTIGEDVYVGSAVTVLPGVSVCDTVVIGAGAVVVDSITQPGVYVGSPSRRIKDHPASHIVTVPGKIVRPN